jgi:pimeloyl-ACP methyl ester carboxylesterase
MYFPATTVILPVFFLLFALPVRLHTQSATQYAGPLPRITSGFGADGSFGVEVQTFPSPLFQGQNVTVYLPQGARESLPVIFFAHGFGAVLVDFYAELLRHLATRGYVVVYSPYQILGDADFSQRYNTLWAGFEAAIRRFPDRIDTTRVGFMGHSYGAGAIPAMAFRAYVERRWGARGRFLFPMAPWYAGQITNEQIRQIPADTKLLMQIYNDDAVNDHQMAVEMFRALPIAPSEKNFVNVLADTVVTSSGRYIYTAGHSLCVTGSSGTSAGAVEERAFDGYDVYAVFRLADALAEYTFTGSQTAKNVALGNGSAEQVFMGVVEGRALRTLVVTHPPMPNPRQRATWLCSNPFNPRRTNCTATSIAAAYATDISRSLTISPNPASHLVFVRGLNVPEGASELVLRNMLGQRVMTQYVEQAGTATDVMLDVSLIPSGIYVLTVYSPKAVMTQTMYIRR